jgi:hypothetical protein
MPDDLLMLDYLLKREEYKMYKKTIVLVLCLMLALPCVAYAENDPPSSLEAPMTLNFSADPSLGHLIFRYTNPQSIIDLIENDYYILTELDWKVNDGPWKYNTNWGSFSTQGVWEYYEGFDDVLGEIVYDDDYVAYGHITHWPFNIDHFDLQNNTYYFRLRYIYEYEAEDPATGEWGYKHVVSPYTEAAIGKLAAGSLPSSLEAPVNFSGELKQDLDGRPYFSLRWDVPDSVTAANQLVGVVNRIDWKIGDGRWASETGEQMFASPGMSLVKQMELDPIDKGGWDEINIEENTYYLRTCFEFEKPDGTQVKSPFSNVISIGTPAYYRGASDWAMPELDKAVEYGLITDSIKANMSGPITREEFAEVATRLYEVYTGKKAEAAPAATFTDTNNPEVLKAYKLGIIFGIGDNKFDPKSLTNREQIATMLTRAVGIIKPTVDLSGEGTPVFADQSEIASYCLDSVKFMTKNGILFGVGGNRFDPKATCTREQAVIIAVRVYEAYK